MGMSYKQLRLTTIHWSDLCECFPQQTAAIMESIADEYLELYQYMFVVGVVPWIYKDHSKDAKNEILEFCDEQGVKPDEWADHLLHKFLPLHQALKRAFLRATRPGWPWHLFGRSGFNLEAFIEYNMVANDDNRLLRENRSNDENDEFYSAFRVCSSPFDVETTGWPRPNNVPPGLYKINKQKVRCNDVSLTVYC